MSVFVLYIKRLDYTILLKIQTYIHSYSTGNCNKCDVNVERKVPNYNFCAFFAVHNVISLFEDSNCYYYYYYYYHSEIVSGYLFFFACNHFLWDWSYFDTLESNP